MNASSQTNSDNNPANNEGPGADTSNQWEWHRRTLLEMRERLIKAHQTHLRASAEPADTESNDLVDLASDRTERDGRLAEWDASEDRLIEVEAALVRLEAGNYGICRLTGRPIDPDRLRAVPWTRFSLEGAEIYEKGKQQQ